MENKTIIKSSLLPNEMKLIGAVIALLSFIGGLSVKMMNKEVANTELIILCTYSGMIMGLLFVALSRDKVEDERINQLRAQSMQFAFIFAAVSTLVRPVIDLLFGDPIEFEKAHSIVFMMLLVYIFCFIFLKKRA